MRKRTDRGLVSSATARVVSWTLLLTPAAILALAATRYFSVVLAMGSAGAFIGGLLFARTREAWRPPVSAAIVVLYLVALGWLWAFTWSEPDRFARATRGLFLVVAVGMLIRHDLLRTGVGPRRQAVSLCRGMRARTRWPQDPEAVATLPEVRALADAIRDDPGPAIELLMADNRPEVRTAAFAALNGREAWRAAEAAAVLNVVRRTEEPAVRAVGVAALAGASDPGTLAGLASFLRDPVPEVRQAAAESLLAAGADHWPVVRELVRDALADQALAADGPLPGAAGRLPAVAVCDLTAWASEADPLAGRSVRTLIGHYAAVLKAGVQPGLAGELGQHIIEPNTPAALRVELAGLLRALGMIPTDLLDRMTDVDQPSPIRLLAAEILLAADPENPDATDVLRGLGRQSNRETSLAVARLLQTYLGMDMGLPDGQIAANSKVAAEAARAVFQWATGRPAPPPPAEHGSAWVTRPVSRPALPGLKKTALPPRTQPPGGGGATWAPR
ncbi:MAG TPA: HEAT repeat domain-containing protein [Fimbriiglobus sp.]|nr:HEAT repeat domain-containing protein [Fimbriiglobus sp.]